MDPKANEGSGFRVYSLGIVTEDKTDDGDYIKVTPIETLPMVKGKLSDVNFDMDVTGTDHKGVTVTSNTKGVGYVVAQYVPIGDSARQTAPNVYESETVILYKFANTDNFYWNDLFREPKLRRLENIVWSFSNLEEKGTEFDNDSSYWMQMSTRDQVVKLHTAKNRDEPAGFDFTIDTAKGTFTIEDTNGNSLFWDAVNGDVKITTTNSFEVDSQMIRYNGQQYVRTNAPEITETGDMIANKATTSIAYTSTGTWVADSGGIILLEKPTTIEGAAIIEGPATVAGPILAEGNVTGANVDLDGHTHTYMPGNGGPTQTSPPVG